MDKKEYNIGLDIGTNSVGWAVVQKDNFKIMRKGNKALWGVRLFDQAETAEQRRIKRSTRRRFERRRERIKLLQEEFKTEIDKVDSDFFFKLKESFFDEKDLVNKKHPLTKEEKEMIKKYYEKYPTIYHLRKELITNNEQKDIRLVYLAIHHILKYRGNFLYEGKDFKIDNLNISEKLYETFKLFSEIESLEFKDSYLEEIDFRKLEGLLFEKYKNDRNMLVKSYLFPYLGKGSSEFAKLICGYKFSFNKLFNLDNEDISISFDGSGFEDNEEKINANYPEQIEVIESLKSLYDMIYLKNIFKNKETTSLSNLMVYYYDTHKKDLEYLKKLLNYDRKEYNRIFRSKDKYMCIYDLYVHNQITSEDFAKELEKSVSVIFDLDILDENAKVKWVNDVQKRIKEGIFLPRITSPANGKYPYQLNKNEIIKIIEKQGVYYPFLLEKVNGTYKIDLILSFKIPYYVGPLVSENNSNFAWMKRKIENVKITPYNFNEVIDKEATAEKFIMRMIGKCTYLNKEYSIPANSLLYSEFKVLNELKQIKINNEKLSTNEIDKIINELFKTTSGTITNKKFIDYLKKANEYPMYSEIKVTGYSADDKFANNLQSYVDFFGEGGFFENTSLTTEDAENIIKWITIFEDKDILQDKIVKEYPELKEKAQRIIKKKYTGWSNLSKRLLTTKYYKDEETNIYKSILDLMKETDKNFMQILYEEKYKFEEMIKEINEVEDTSKLNYEVVNELATSPANKRGIWQALQIVEEIVDYIGYEPYSISIEMARGEEKKERKDDRKKYLTNLYEKSKETIQDYKKLKKQLDSCEKISSERLYLYFIQEGKCLYSGEPLELENINNTELYEVDHIIPRSLIKNDSFENKALVLREYNQNKRDNLVLPYSWIINQRKWWNQLKDKKLISQTKFYNLTRKEYKEEDIEGFINRQLVETRQITKHVANIINSYHKKTKVLYLPAALNHNYREKFELFKFRDLNNYHHAHDAYLTAVLGEYKHYINSTLTFEELKKINNNLIKEKKYNELKYGYVINSISEDFEHYNKKTGEYLDITNFKNTIEKTLYRNDILMSKKTEIRTGKMFDETKLPKGKKGVPLKKGYDTKKYGSYTKLNPAYAMGVKYKIKNVENAKLIGIPIYYGLNNDNSLLDAYIKDILKLKKEDTYEFITPKLPFYTKLNWEGQICYLVGATDKVEVCNAKDLQLTKSEQQKFKYMLYKLLNKKEYVIEDEKYEKLLSEFIEFIVKKVEKEYILFNNLIPQMKEMFINKDLTLEEKEKTIIQLLKLLNCKSDNANLKFLDDKYSSAFGKKNDRIISSAQVINTSVTGIKERKYEF